MFENEELKDYYYIKFLQSYLYDDDIYNNALDGGYNYYIFNEDFVAILTYYVEKYTNPKYICFDIEIKDRLYNLINYIRYNVNYYDDEVKKYYCDVFNNLIIKLNQMQQQSSYGLILHELIIRTGIKLGDKISYNKYKKRKKKYK